MAMKYCCETKEATKSKGRPVVTLSVLLFNHCHHFKSFKKTEESKSKKGSVYKQKEQTVLRELRELAIDRYGWAGFTRKPCRVSEGL
jgi:hypothetical protein